MGSFTTNMHYHITLQAERTAIYLAVKESYIYISSQGKHKKLQKFMSREKKNMSAQTGLRIPGAFSHMSHCGTSLGSASPTRTCRLASLLHI